MQGQRPTAEIRPLKPEDLGWLLEHAIAGWEPRLRSNYAPYAAGRIHAFLTHPAGEFKLGYVADRFGERVGACMLVLNNEMNGTVELFYVLPRAQGVGIGSQLLGSCLDQAKAMTLLSVTAEAYDDQPIMDHVLCKHGFKRERGKEKTDRFGLPKPYWRYRLGLPLHRPTSSSEA